MKQASSESPLSMIPINNGVRSCWYSSLAYFTGGLAGNLWRPCEGSIGCGREERGADLSPRPCVGRYRFSRLPLWGIWLACAQGLLNTPRGLVELGLKVKGSRHGDPKASTVCAGGRRYANHWAYPLAEEAPDPASRLSAARWCVLARKAFRHRPPRKTSPEGWQVASGTISLAFD
jgi:hypothetical protein